MVLDPTNPQIAPPVPQGNSGVDPLQVAWRWKWLILLGAILGGGAGFFYWIRQPQQFMAFARIQVVRQLSDEIPLKALEGEGGVFNVSRADEAMIIGSKRVLFLAVEKGRLTQNPALLGQSAEQIVMWIKGHLDVNPASKDVNTTIINISFTCQDPDLATDVVRSVVEGYNAFLGLEYEVVGDKLLKQVTSVKDEIEQRYSDLSSKYTEFRKNSPLYFVGDVVKDPFADSVQSALAEIGELELKLIAISSVVNAAEEAIAAKRDPDAIMLMLESELGVRMDGVTNPPIASSLEAKLNRAEEIRRTQLMPLVLQKKQMVSAGYGPSHPNMIAVDSKIQFYNELVAKTAEAEQQEVDLIKKEAEESESQEFTSEDRLASLINGLREKQLSLSKQIDQVKSFKEENAKNSRELQANIAQNNLLSEQVKATNEILSQLKLALSNLGISKDYGRRTMQELEVNPGAPNGPFLMQPLAIGALLGAVLFGGLAYLLEMADRSYRSPEEISFDLGLPIMGHVPSMELANTKLKDAKIEPSLISFHRSQSSQAEAFRGVRTALYFSNRRGTMKVIQVTSPVPGDGKSTVAANLATTIAQSGRKVVLVEGDFRRPRVAKIFGADNQLGVTQVISGEIELEDAIQQSSVENLSLLPSGKKPNNPAELLVGQGFEQLLSVLREKFDYVIIDSPPLLAVSDPSNIAGRVDGVVLTLRLRRNLRPIASRAAQMLQALGANVVGIVVNGVSGQDGYGGNYKYGSGYGNGYRGYGYQQGYGYGYGTPYGYGSQVYGRYYEEDAAELASAGRREVTNSGPSKAPRA